MTVSIQEVVEIASGGMAVGAGVMRGFHQLFSRGRKLTREDVGEAVREVMEKAAPKNGSTPLTKDAHAAICAGNMKALADSLDDKFSKVYDKIDDQFKNMLAIMAQKK